MKIKKTTKIIKITKITKIIKSKRKNMSLISTKHIMKKKIFRLTLCHQNQYTQFVWNLC